MFWINFYNNSKKYCTKYWFFLILSGILGQAPSEGNGQKWFIGGDGLHRHLMMVTASTGTAQVRKKSLIRA